MLSIASQESRVVRQRNPQPTAMETDSGGAEPRCARTEMSGGTRRGAKISQHMG